MFQTRSSIQGQYLENVEEWIDYISLRQGSVNNIFLKHNSDRCWVLIRQYLTRPIFTVFSLNMGLPLIHSMSKQDPRAFLDVSHSAATVSVNRFYSFCFLAISESTSSLHPELLHQCVIVSSTIEFSASNLMFFYSWSPQGPCDLSKYNLMASLSCLRPFRIPLVPSE